MAFNANSIGRQTHEVRKQLQDVKIDMALFSLIHMKPHMRAYIPNYDTCQTDRQDGHKGGTAIVVKERIPHAPINFPPLRSAEATGVYMPIGNTEMFLRAV
jgi:hypothetical protein